MDKHEMRIVIRMPNWLGDLVMALAAVEDLKKTYPKAHLCIVCLSSHADFIKRCLAISDVIEIKRRGFLQILQTSLEIRKSKFTHGVLFTNSFSSALIFFLGRVKQRFGYSKDLRSFLLTSRCCFPKDRSKEHHVVFYKKLLTLLGVPLSSQGPKITKNCLEINFGKTLIKERGVKEGDILVGINPGAAFGSAKCWIPSRFQEVTTFLLSYNPKIKVLFFGDTKTKPLVDEICKPFSNRVINLSAKTSLIELCSLISLCDLFLTNDSGPMHIADALGVDLLAIFGSTNPFETGPFHKKNLLVGKAECAPCFKRVCPIDFRCMKSITANDVTSNIKKILEGKEYV